MSAIALFVALGGTAVAVSALPKNSVGPKQLKKNAVNSSKVKDGSLQSGDFAGVLQAGKQGEKGAPGEHGPPGEPGQPATKIYAFIRTGNCCGGSPPLDPPLILNGHGVTAAAIGSVGEYQVTFDNRCCPMGTSKTACRSLPSAPPTPASRLKAPSRSAIRPGSPPKSCSSSNATAKATSPSSTRRQRRRFQHRALLLR